MTTASQLPARFRFTEPQLAAALALGGIRAGPRSLLPAVAPVPDPAGLLRDSAALSGDSLDPTCAAALSVVADPATISSIIANRGGERTWAETLIAHGAKDTAFVAFPAAGGCDYTYLGTAAQTALYADLLLGFSGGTSRPGGPATDLTLPALAALVALADMRMEEEQRALLERRVGGSTLEVTPAQLEAQLAAGLQSDDTRWAVTALQHVSSVDLRAATGRLGEGLNELGRVGLVTGSAQNWVLSPEGLDRVAMIAPVLVSGAITLALLHGQGRTTLMSTSLLRTARGILLLTWSGADSDVKTIRMSEVTAAQALEFVGALLETELAPPPVANLTAPTSVSAPLSGSLTPTVTATRFCAACGAALRATSRFCSACGHTVGAPVP